ncbi:MAG TPA: cyclic pyranopterin monophosphate synthase MoaC [Aestuariivirgaceae bacterium]|nr:cyclic pyranopterin monophosphate synthase MoaC [Aestuariivirgaceae bacterium]
MASPPLTHLDEKGQARMVDVTEKNVTSRIATARATVRMRPETLSMILSGGIPKGDVFSAARIAGIMAAKRTHELIPLCHPLAITAVTLDFTSDQPQSQINIEATVKVDGRTGVEMEALTAAAIAALTLYDMCKAIDREMTIEHINLVEKSGGKSGHFKRRGS